MHAARVRIAAWALALLLAAIALTRGGGRRSDKWRLPEPPIRDTASAAPPRLFWTEGPLEEISAPRLAGELVRVERSAPPPDVEKQSLRAAHVIREPLSGGAARDPELELSPSYRLSDGAASREAAARQVPVELILNAPHGHEAPVAPRVSREIAAQPAQLAARPSPLPSLASADPAMQPVHDVARQHVQRGFSLGERSALYAARTEFIQALRTIAQAVDAQAALAPKDEQSCSQALVRGLEALAEADDFAPGGSRLDGNLDLASIIAAHRTPACKRSEPATQLAALQAYFDYARDELVRAAAGSSVASQALTGLGKTYTAAPERNAGRLASAKAMVFHQAAVAADARNHLSANELGVLLARHGQLKQAKLSLLQSLRVQRDPVAWQNLAAVHTRLGEAELARLAQQERDLMLRRRPAASGASAGGSPTVQWVDPQAFAGPPEEAQRPAAPTTPKSAQPPQQTPPATAQKADAWSWLPWR